MSYVMALGCGCCHFLLSPHLSHYSMWTPRQVLILNLIDISQCSVPISAGQIVWAVHNIWSLIWYASKLGLAVCISIMLLQNWKSCYNNVVWTRNKGSARYSADLRFKYTSFLICKGQTTYPLYKTMHQARHYMLCLSLRSIYQAYNSTGY